jgi:hypothetical protein
MFHGQLSQLENEFRYSHQPNPSAARKEVNIPPSDSNNAVLEYFKDAGVRLHDEDIRSLPTWSEIEALIGEKPVILGLEKCETFRNKIPPLRRMIGASGMFNSGTNLVSPFSHQTLQIIFFHLPICIDTFEFEPC